MEKLEKYILNQSSKYFFMLLLVLIPVQMLLALYEFYNSSYHILLLKSYIGLSLLKAFLSFLPVLFMTPLFYTMNVCFPDRTLRSYNTEKIIRPFFKYSLLYLAFIIILVAVFDTTIAFREEQFEIRNRELKAADRHGLAIREMEKRVQKLVEEKKYYPALEVLEDILILVPAYAPAKEQIILIRQKIDHANELYLKILKKEGEDLFRAGDFKKALDLFTRYNGINERNEEIIRYMNLCRQELNLKEKLVIKDRYKSTIRLNPDERNMIKYNIRVKGLIDRGLDAFRQREYTRALDLFKEVLVLDVNNYDAYSYSLMVQKRIAAIRYYTNTSDKILQTGLEYRTDRYQIRIGRLAKAEYRLHEPLSPDRTEEEADRGQKEIITYKNMNAFQRALSAVWSGLLSKVKSIVSRDDKVHYYHYLFYNTTFTDRKTKASFTKQYGFYDIRKKAFVFRDDLIRETGRTFTAAGLNPEFIWNYRRLIREPEKFSLQYVLSAYSYFRNNLGDLKTYSRIMTVKINYYVLIIFLFFNLLTAGFYMRRKEGEIKVRISDLIILPVLSAALYFLFWKSFTLLKAFISRGFQLPRYILPLNVLFYLLFFVLFFILFRTLKSPPPVRSAAERG